MKPKNILNKRVSFHAIRITAGNPVIGTVVYQDTEGFEVRLEHDIEGLVTVCAGTVRGFHWSLIDKLKIL